MTIEDELAESKQAVTELSEILVRTAITAETAIRVLMSLAKRTGVPEPNLVKAMCETDARVAADLKAGRFSALKFGEKQMLERASLSLPTNGEANDEPDPLR
jgi:hypothetical protein